SDVPEIYRSLTEHLLKLSAPMLANEVAAEGLQRWPEDLRLRQLQGLALARSGATERAHRILADLAQEGHADEETYGLLAHTYKDLGLLAAHPGEQRRYLLLAYQTYAKAYEHFRSIWPGINAATLAVLLGQKEQGQKLARAIRTRCLADLDRLK